MKVTQVIQRFIALIFFILFFQSFAFAEDAAITDISVKTGATDLLLSLKMEGAFQKKMEEAVLNGIPSTFSFLIKLKRQRTLWLDDTIRTLKVTHTIKYDSLKSEFRINRSWEGDNPLTTNCFKEAQILMSEISGLKIVPLDQLQKGKRYRIKAKAELDKDTLPFFLNYILLTFLWDFETKWRSLSFTY